MSTTTQKDIKWRIVPEETYTTSIAFALNDQDSSMGKLKASIKWDGCTHLWLPYDERLSIWHEHEVCYHHICDLDEFILYLQSVREKARAYFNGEFGLAPLGDREHKLKVTEIQREEQAS